MFGGDQPLQQQYVPTVPTAPPPPIVAASPQGSKPGRKASQSTFLGAIDTPSASNYSGKTLLGQ